MRRLVSLLALIAAPMLVESGAVKPEELQHDMPRLIRIMALIKVGGSRGHLTSAHRSLRQRMRRLILFLTLGSRYLSYIGHEDLYGLTPY